jgi:hypothetical protein
MKKFTIHFAIIAFLFMGYSSMAQKGKHGKIKNLFERTNHHLTENPEKAEAIKTFISSKGQISRPGNSEDYFWEQGSNVWYHSSNSVYSYNETGQLLEQLTTEPMLGTNMSKETMAYDTHGNMTEYISYYWIENAWEISWGNKRVYTYDNNGNITEEIYQWWDYLSSSWVNESKNVNAYDNNGNFTEQYHQYWENGAWVNEWRELVTNSTSGIPIEVTNYYWEGGEWIPDEKYIDIVWHNWENWEYSEPESYIGQYYDNGQWINYVKYNAIYTGENYVGTYEMWENNAWVNSDRDTYTETATEQIYLYQYWENGQWVNSERETQTFDDHGTPTGYISEYWENGAWVINYASAETHTYNNDGDITETISMYWDEMTSSFVNFSKYVYSNFYYFQSGITGRKSSIDVSIYPNPVSSSINIKMNEAGINQYQVEILNITGQTVYTNSYSSFSSSINVENLETGLYFVRIITDNNKTHSYKIMKD